MAKAIGQLREGKATFGEKEVFRLLTKNLPNDFSVYAECPITENRQDFHPDFIVLTNYGFVVLEVKDWKSIDRVDAYYAYVNTSSSLFSLPFLFFFFRRPHVLDSEGESAKILGCFDLSIWVVSTSFFRSF